MEKDKRSIAALAQRYENHLTITERESTRGRYEFLTSLISQGDRVLDIGINSGSELRLLATKASHIVGIDSLQMEAEIAAYNSSDIPAITIIQMNGEHLGFPNDSFDVVTSLECLEHVDNPDEVVQEVIRVLRPDGVAVFSTPNSDISGRRFVSQHHHREWSFNQFKEYLGGYFPDIEWYGQRVTTGTPMQLLFTTLRSSIMYDVYKRMPRQIRSRANHLFKNATLGDSWAVKRLNIEAGERPISSIAVCRMK